MKTPKEKANELIEKYSNVEIQIGGQYDGYLSMQIHDAKECALILVDEILKVVSFYNDSQAEVIYFKEVKQEIEKL
jgi:hypothetical protein